MHVWVGPACFVQFWKDYTHLAKKNPPKKLVYPTVLQSFQRKQEFHDGYLILGIFLLVR